MQLKRSMAVALTHVGLAAFLLLPANAAEPEPIEPDRLRGLHELIGQQPGESRFWELPWLLDTWEARRKAAAEGKPIFVWCGSQGAPIGGC